MQDQSINWLPFLTIVAANIAMFIGMLGTTIALYLHSDRKFEFLGNSIRDEMKDFHGRLCDIEARKGT